MLRFSSAEMPFLQTTSDPSEFICQQIITTKKWTADMFTDGLQETHLRVIDASVRTSESAGNVGLIFDKTFDMSTSRLFVGLRSIKDTLIYGSLEKVIHAFISSRLDYCNAPCMVCFTKVS